MERNVTKLAEKVNASKPFIFRVLTGQRSPSPKMAARLEKATGIPRLAWLYPDEFENPMIRKPNQCSQ